MRAAFYSAQSLHKHIQWRWMQVITDNLVNCFTLDVCLCLGNIQVEVHCFQDLFFELDSIMTDVAWVPTSVIEGVGLQMPVGLSRMVDVNDWMIYPKAWDKI